MSQANVNVGTAPGAGNGDNLYNAFTKINNNFTELYGTITSSGTTYANISPSVDSSASGSGLTLNITKYANIYGVSVNLAGTNYAVGETVRVWGNVVGGSYTTHDLIVEVGTVGNVSTGNVTAVTFTGTPSRPVLTVAGRTGDVVLTTNDIVGLRSTFSSNADIQSVVDAKISANITSLVGTAPGVLDTLGEIADALNDDANVYNTLVTTITTANTNMKGYTDNLVTTANTNMKGYVDAEITAIGAHYGNADVLAYLNDNNYATETYVDTANVNLKGYVDGEITTVNGVITTANTNVVGYVDSAVTTANLNLKGYVDGEIATVTAGHYGNADVLAYLNDNSYATETFVTTANTNVVGYVDSAVSTANVNMKGYVDGQVTTLNSTITTANTNVVGYVDSAVSTANVNLKGYVDNELTSYATTSALTTANTNVVGYVDGQVTTLNSALTTANTNVVGYVDGQVTTLNSTITTANTNVVGYVDNAVSTANVNLKGYVDAANVNVVGYVDSEINNLIGGAPGTLDTLNEIAAALGDDPNLATTLTNTITTANTNMKGYVDGQVTTLNSTITTANTNVVGYVDGEITTVNSAITTANTNVVGYVDNAVSTANVNLKGYVDNEITGLSLGNISTVDLNGNVSTVLAGDGTFIAAGSGGSGISNVVEDTTPQLGGNLDLNGNYITGTGNIAITGNIIGDNRVTGSLIVDDSIAVENNVTLNGGVIQIEGQTGNITATNIKATDYEYANGTSIIDTINSTIDADISTANVNLKGYVDAANVNVVGYVDNAVSTANVNVVGYVDAANVNVVGYVDNAVTTANVNLKGYVDNEISGLSLGNISTINLDGNVSNVLAGDGTFITAGTGSLTAVVEDTTPQLGGDLDLNSSDITGTGNINITGTLTTSGTATFNGDAIFETGVEEKFATLTSSTGTVTHNCDNGHIFYHTTPSGNITANFTNLGLTAEYATTVTCIVNQGATAYIVNGVQIGGSAQTINWQGGVEPTGTDNGIDSFSFTILNDGGTYVVLGQMVDFT